MQYCTIKELEDLIGETKLIELSHTKKHGQRPTAVNATTVERAIKSGDGVIDSYIGQRVSLPISTVPSFINTLSIDLAMYYLHKNKGNTAGKDNPNRDLYTDSLAHLERFAEGKTSLGLHIPDDGSGNGSGNTDDDIQANHAEIVSAPRQFTRTKMGGLT